MSVKYFKKGVKDEIDVLHAGKHQSFLKVYFNTFNISVSSKGDYLTWLVGPLVIQG